MKIFVLITLIAAARIIRSGTLNERPDAKAKLSPRIKARLQAKNQAKSKANTLGRLGPSRVIKAKTKAKAKANRLAKLKAMAKLMGKVCPTNGFSSLASQCTCNFAGACDLKTNTVLKAAQADPKNLNGVAPQGLLSLALGSAKSVGTVCEGGTVAVLYDCNARSALYAATVINGAFFTGVKPAIGRGNNWISTRDTNLLQNPQLLATDTDYVGSSTNIYCYEDGAGNFLNWDGTGPCSNPQPNVSIHKGHLIAARYGKTHGTQNAIDATFAYTNAVPQVGRFNSVEWRIGEADYVIENAELCQSNAQKKGKTINAKIYVVVGVIPSSFLGKPRFFGSAGFGSFQSTAKRRAGDYRISFPEIMWTAGCCIYTDGQIGGKFGFWRRNDLTKAAVNIAPSPSDMFKDIQQEISKTWPGPPAISFKPPIVFPSKPTCNK